MNEIFLPLPNGIIPVHGDSFVFVGANGAGKSQLGAWLEESGSGRRPSHRVSAQRALQMTEFIELLPREQAERRLFFGHDQEGSFALNRRFNRWNDDPVGHLLNDFDALLASLVAQESERDAGYVRRSREQGSRNLLVPDSRLDVLKKIWNELLPHRQISFDGGKVVASMTGAPAKTYHGRQMSDGERVLVYLIGQALCAPKDALLIIDEPETHLHRAIREKLWDSIEQARKDCLFVFITHDLEFAASRESATVIWVKSFDASTQHPGWDWEECPKSLDLPTELVLQVLGSRKQVIFVEGDSVKSLDAKLYKLIYPGHRVIPVGGAQNVDRCVTALRTVGSLHHTKPYGIVDRDRRSPEEITSLAGRGITCCPFAEVENLLLEEKVLASAVARAGIDTKEIPALVQEIKERVLAKLVEEGDQQAAQWGEAIVARRLAGFSSKHTVAAKVAADVESHARSINVNEIYSTTRKAIDTAIATKSYSEALRVFNQKGLVALASSFISARVEGYERLALAAIRDDAALRQHLADLIALA